MPTTDFKRNVYILGAGFSQPAKAPLMNDFFDAMHECSHDSRLVNDDAECINSALKFRQEMAKASDNFVLSLDNLEELFGLLEVQITSGDKTKEDRRKFVHAVLRTLELRSQGPEEPGNAPDAHLHLDYAKDFFHSPPFD